MPRKCTVCQHPQRQDIERALLAGASLSSLAQKHHLSTSALSRHHQHLKDRLQEVIPLLQQQRQQEWLASLALLLKLVVQAGEVFAVIHRHDLVLKSAREAATLIKVMRPLNGSPSPLAAFHLLHSPHYVWDGTLVTSSPEVYAAERRSLADNFFTSCPDLSPPPENPLDQQEEENLHCSPAEDQPDPTPSRSSTESLATYPGDSPKNSPSGAPAMPTHPQKTGEHCGFPPSPGNDTVSGNNGMNWDELVNHLAVLQELSPQIQQHLEFQQQAAFFPFKGLGERVWGRGQGPAAPGPLPPPNQWSGIYSVAAAS